MPFTPLHMGPGMVVKAVIPRHFNWVVFGFTQMALDLEVLWHMGRRELRRHAVWHTCFGESLAALVRPVSIPTTWTASLPGASAGAYGRILLDSLVHPDVEPQRSGSATRRLKRILPPPVLEDPCVGLGLSSLFGGLNSERRRRKTCQAARARGCCYFDKGTRDE